MFISGIICYFLPILIVVGVSCGWYHIVEDYFDRNFNMLYGKWTIFNKILLLTICVSTLVCVYLQYYVCVYMAFGIATTRLLWVHSSQFYTDYQKHLFVKKRRELYSRISDEQIVDEVIILKVDKTFSAFFFSYTVTFVTWFFSVLSDCFGTKHGWINNLINSISVEGSKHLIEVLGIDIIIIAIGFFVLSFLGINYFELQMRKIILEEIIAANDLNKKVFKY